MYYKHYFTDITSKSQKKSRKREWGEGEGRKIRGREIIVSKVLATLLMWQCMPNASPEGMETGGWRGLAGQSVPSMHELQYPWQTLSQKISWRSDCGRHLILTSGFRHIHTCACEFLYTHTHTHMNVDTHKKRIERNWKVSLYKVQCYFNMFNIFLIIFFAVWDHEAIFHKRKKTWGD